MQNDVRNTCSPPRHAAEEVHPEDTDARVVLDSEVNVFLHAEAEVSSVGEVLHPQGVLLDLEATLENLHRLFAPHSAVDGNLLVTPDAERPDGVPGLRVDRVLAGKLLKDLRSPSRVSSW
jgi:hypothetical protein